MNLALCILLAATPAGFPRMSTPRRGPERDAAEARVLEVFDAIDAATPDPELRAELRRICIRESWCNWYGEVGSHGDGPTIGRLRWRKAVDRGLLSPAECPAHELGDDPDVWSTVGAFGTVAAFVVRHAGPCVAPRELFEPAVAVKATLGHVRVLCRRQRACSCPERAAWWAGPGRFELRSPPHQLSSITRQCGPQSTFDWVLAYAELPLWHAERILEDLGELGEAIAEHLPDLEEDTIAS